jgi:hypothetical protein
MRFNLPIGHTNKDSTNYQQCKHRFKDGNTRHVRTTLHVICQGVLNGFIPLAVSLAGNVECWHVERRVKIADMFLLGQHVTNMLANMLAT